jgi:putative hydrolase of the HAD superfamily
MNTQEKARYVNLIREQSSPLEPEKVMLDPTWEALTGSPVLARTDKGEQGIRALLFDLYGTLFISAAGDIAEVSPSENSERVPEEMKSFFRQRVGEFHEEEKKKGNLWPDPAVEEIWADYSGSVPAAWGLCAGAGRPPQENRELALRCELALNPVYPMPGALELIRALAGRGFTLGIISNAQFFSPLLFDAFFSGSPEELGFEGELLIYSFAKNEAKPSPRLFREARSLLARRGVKPEETLYVGNDMKKDILPASGAGFRTALFAGDRRSLRIREDDPACASLKPDFVLKDLQSILPGR